MKKPTVATYSMDLGSIGFRDVSVEGTPKTTFEGKRIFEVERVWLNVDGVMLDLYPHISQKVLEAMQYALWTIAFNETTRGREAAGEVGA